MKYLLAALLTAALLILAGCTAPCPYAGAVVEVTYQQASDLAKIRDVLVTLGWQQTSIGTRDVINGTLDGAVVSALVSDRKTTLSVHFLHSTNAADYPKEDQQAAAVLLQVQAPVAKALGLQPADPCDPRLNCGGEG